MSNFHSLADVLAAMNASEGTATPVKPLALGEFVGAAVVRSGSADGGLHRQPDHEELLVVIEGKGEFGWPTKYAPCSPATSCSSRATPCTGPRVGRLLSSPSSRRRSISRRM